MINLVQPADICCLWLSHLQQIAIANGPLTTGEHRMLQATAKHFGVNVPAPSKVTDDELRNCCRDRNSAKSLLQLGMLFALIDRNLNSAVIAELDRIRHLTGADDSFFSLLGAIHTGDHLTVIRKYRARVVLPLLKRKGKIAGARMVFHMARRYLGLGGSNPEVARKYRRLGLLPEGTFGRATWQLIRSQDMEFPGEPLGLPEGAFYHDCSHVLSNYATSPLGEQLHSWFIGGYYRDDPFLHSSMGFLQFYYAIPLVPFSQSRGDIFEPERMFEGYERGIACMGDLSELDLWPYMSDPLDVAREKLNIKPRSDLEDSVQFA